MTGHRINILDWAAWGEHPPGSAVDERWAIPLSGEDGMARSAPARKVGAGIRRRLSDFGRSAAEVAGQVLEERAATIVFASRHGDIHRTVKLLQQVVGGDLVSPTDFSMSVHNAVAGIMSMSWKLKLPITAVAAGEDSLGAGFTEALGIANADPETPVLLVYVDVCLPDVYVGFELEDGASFALAVLIQVGEPAEEAPAQITCRPIRPPNEAGSSQRQARELSMFLSGLGDDIRFGSKRSGWALKRD